MNTSFRNGIVCAILLVVWIFFFVPNQIFSFMNIQGLDSRMPGVVLFGAIPFAVSMSLMFLTAGRPIGRSVVSLAVPLGGVVLCLVFWWSGLYTDEDLLGAWFYSLTPLIAYGLGIVVALLILSRSRARAG
jgi:hypothetical protein